jgi:hypothetical protein
MITETIKLLNSNEFLGISESIEILKGKNEIPKNFQDVKNKIKRQWHLQKK